MKVFEKAVASAGVRNVEERIDVGQVAGPMLVVQHLRDRDFCSAENGREPGMHRRVVPTVFGSTPGNVLNRLH